MTTTNLPKPCGWKVLIKRQKAKDKTSGGIFLPDIAKDAEELLGIVAQVVDCGPMCWKDRDTGEPWSTGPWAKPGDFVVVPKFTHFRMTINEEEYRFINDDEIIAIVDDPSIIKIYV